MQIFLSAPVPPSGALRPADESTVSRAFLHIRSLVMSAVSCLLQSSCHSLPLTVLVWYSPLPPLCTLNILSAPSFVFLSVFFLYSTWENYSIHQSQIQKPSTFISVFPSEHFRFCLVLPQSFFLSNCRFHWHLSSLSFVFLSVIVIFCPWNSSFFTLWVLLCCCSQRLFSSSKPQSCS